jgi:hypothetical protein
MPGSIVALMAAALNLGLKRLEDLELGGDFSCGEASTSRGTHLLGKMRPLRRHPF